MSKIKSTVLVVLLVFVGRCLWCWFRQGNAFADLEVSFLWGIGAGVLVIIGDKLTWWP